jgi:PTS system nitrogen regulatory IIA component
MANEDFDVVSLAQYLHLRPEQVLRMAERGKLPGRKLGNDWRFSEAEVHHWLEDRIGASDENELIEVEEVLEKGRQHEPAAESPILIAELLPVHGIAVPLAARTRNSVIEDMVELAANTGWLWDPERMADAIRTRENLHPTAIDNGVALLHPRRPLASIVAQPFLVLGITPSGVPFGAARGGMTDVFFLIQATNDREHLRILARISRLIGLPDFLDQLRSAGDPLSVHELIAEREQELT